MLHHYPYRDSSLLVEIFSRDHGRVGLVARGARSPKSRWHSQLQILQPLLLSWNMRGELGTLTGAEGRAAAPVRQGNKVLCACYLNELLLRLLSRHDPHAALFAAYEQALAGLDLAEEPALRYFEKHLLQELGYGLLLDCEFESDRPIDPAALYEYRLEQGPVPCHLQGSEGIYLHGTSLLALAGECLEEQQALRDVKKLTRAALSLYLGARPLKTREVSNQLASIGRSRRPVPADPPDNATLEVTP